MDASQWRVIDELGPDTHYPSAASDVVMQVGLNGGDRLVSCNYVPSLVYPDPGYDQVYEFDGTLWTPVETDSDPDLNAVEYNYLVSNPNNGSLYKLYYDSIGGRVGFRERTMNRVWRKPAQPDASDHYPAPYGFSVASIGFDVLHNQLLYVGSVTTAGDAPITFDTLIYDVEADIWFYPTLEFALPEIYCRSAVYDAVIQQLVFFGGYYGTSMDANVYAWDGSQYLLQSISGDIPPMKMALGAAYVPRSLGIITCGGIELVNGGGEGGWTRFWDGFYLLTGGNRWTRLSTTDNQYNDASECLTAPDGGTRGYCAKQGHNPMHLHSDGAQLIWHGGESANNRFSYALPETIADPNSYTKTMMIYVSGGPEVIEIVQDGERRLIVTFNREMLNNTDLVNPNAYSLTSGVRVANVQRIAENKVILTTSHKLRAGRRYELRVNAVPR